MEQNTFTHNASVSACEKDSHGGPLAETAGVAHGGVAMQQFELQERAQWLRAPDLMAEMTHGRVEHDTIKYSAAVNDCEEAGHWFWTVEMLTEMADICVQQNTITHTAAISACNRAANGCAQGSS